MDAIICPECGASNPVEAQICQECNADLSAVKSVVDAANSHYNEALALAHSGKLDEAIGQLEAALALSSDNPQFHNLLGTIYGQKGLYSEAIRSWEQCIALDPEFEKAYKNIEKARDLEEDAAEEEERRPYVMYTYGAAALAALMLVLTLYIGWRLNTKNRMIDDMNEKIELSRQTVDAWKDKATQAESELAVFKQNFPDGGIQGVLDKINELQSLADTREAQVRRITEMRNKERDALRDEINAAQTEVADLKRELQKINALQAELTTSTAKAQSLESQLNETKQSLQLALDQVQNYRKLSEEAEQSLKDARRDHEQEIQSIRRTYDQNIETLRENIRQLQDEVAASQRVIDDLRYANELAAQAWREYQQNDFELAMQNIDAAMQRAPQHAFLTALQSDVDQILADPLEQELRRQEAQTREQNRMEQRIQLAQQLARDAELALRDSRLDDAIQIAERARRLAPGNERIIDDAGDVIAQAEERKRQIAILLLEIKESIADNDIDEARKKINQVFKLSEDNPEAQALLTQIQRSQES